jgi:hypothetical protein
MRFILSLAHNSSAEILRTFRLLQSASRRRAEAALWRAAKAEGLAQSKTLRGFHGIIVSRAASWSAAALRRFSRRHIKLCQH